MRNSEVSLSSCLPFWGDPLLQITDFIISSQEHRGEGCEIRLTFSLARS